MDLNKPEIDYYIKLYNHGINHLIEDTIPNRIICVHNLHWIVENLLRKATKDWHDIDYRDGFEEVFTKFCNKRTIIVSPIHQKKIKILNKIRNDMEHRELYHDIIDIQNLIPHVKDFIQWIIKTRFNTTINLQSIPSADEKEIYKDFERWMNSKLNENYEMLINQEEQRLYDYLFLCIIPASYSSQLIDLSRDTTNEFQTQNTITKLNISVSNPEYSSKIEEYYTNLRHIFYGNHQIYTISPYFRYYDDFYGNEMRIFPNGEIYICYYYREFDPENPKFTLKSTIREDLEKYRITSTSNKYGLNFDIHQPGNLRGILKIVCFPYTSDCRIKIVNISTNYFKCKIIVPNMRYNGRNRMLDSHEFFSRHRIYAGDENNITFEKLFSYTRIDDFVDKFIEWTYGFFTNIRNTSF